MADTVSVVAVISTSSGIRYPSAVVVIERPTIQSHHRRHAGRATDL